jgi:hypothetical protein
MAVVKLRRRKRPLEARKRPETGLSAGAGGSEVRPKTPAFCGLQSAIQTLKKNVPNGETGGATRTVLEPSLVVFQRLMDHTNFGACCLKNPERVADRQARPATQKGARGLGDPAGRRQIISAHARRRLAHTSLTRHADLYCTERVPTCREARRGLPFHFAVRRAGERTSPPNGSG